MAGDCSYSRYSLQTLFDLRKPFFGFPCLTQPQELELPGGNGMKIKDISSSLAEIQAANRLGLSCTMCLQDLDLALD